MLDIIWLLVCAGLIFLMQPGFMCLESGLTRSKNSINVAIKNLADFGLSVFLFWVFGYALMFGISQGGWFGKSDFFVAVDGVGTAYKAAFFLFEVMFCGTATTIVSGAVAERMKFSAYLMVACLISGIIYPLFGHWAWNGIETATLTGWLGKLGFRDFAGATVVHSVGAWVALAALIVIGSRTGRFPPNAPPEKMRGFNIPLSVLGTMLLWLGWLGFNGGSSLTFNEQVAPTIFHTIIAGAAGMMMGGSLSLLQYRWIDVEFLINGTLAGLVAITASCYAVSTPIAALIGAVGAAVMVFTLNWLERLHIDDALGAVAVHGGGGVWGTLAVALFASPEILGTGLSRWQQILVQLLGIGVAFIWAFGLTWFVLYIANRFFPLRVSVQAEEMGLNVAEHHAKTEVYHLFEVMDTQARTKDLSLRVPVEPFTEVGYIAQRYNSVMDALEEALQRTETIVKTATDAIITFSTQSWEIITANPSAERIFGYSQVEFVGIPLSRLLVNAEAFEDFRSLLQQLLQGEYQEIVGYRANGESFDLEVAVTLAKMGNDTFYSGTFRDISDRKQAQLALAAANEEIQKLNEQLKSENLRLSAELEISRKLQQMLLPTTSELDKVTELEIAGFMEAADEVGGDYYDVLSQNGRIKVGIGDVTGHGLESGVLMIMVQTAVRTLIQHNETNPVKFFKTLNRTIYENVQRMNSDRNLSLSLLDYFEGTLYLSGQHEEMIVIRATGEIERIDTIDLGFPLGLVEDIAEFVGFRQVDLETGDVVVLYTDGITEAEDNQRNFYGLERLCEVLKNNAHQSAEEIRKTVIEDVRSHIDTHKVYDDITLVVLKQR